MSRQHVRDEQRASYVFLIRWIIIALIAGVVGASALAGFRYLLTALLGVIYQTGIAPPIAAMAAALLVGLIIYRVAPDAAGEGMPSYLHALSRSDARFPLSVTIWKLPAALLTLAGGGSGGVIGPVGRAVSGLMSLLGRKTDGEIDAGRARTAAICGMAATVAALLHAPVAGGIFAVEIIQRANMRYRELFPSVLAGAASVWVSRAFGWEPLFSLRPPVQSYPIAVTPWLIVFAVVVGVAGGLFVRGYALAVRVFRRDQGRTGVKVLVGMALASGIVWLVNPAIASTASELTNGVINGDRLLVFVGDGFESALRSPIWLAALVLMLIRALVSFLTTGSGMSAGLTGPAIQIGLLGGLAAASVYGALSGNEASVLSGNLLPSSTPEGLAFLVVGLVGMLAGSMNVPIAAAVMGVEIFGIAFGVPAVFASVISFQLNRHQTIYDFALAGSGHMDETDRGSE